MGTESDTRRSSSTTTQATTTRDCRIQEHFPNALFPGLPCEGGLNLLASINLLLISEF